METKYNDIFENFKYLNYEEEDNIKKANEIIYKINDNNDYWKIPKIIKIYLNYLEEYPKIIINYVKEIIDFLLNSIKEKLSKEKEILEKEDLNKVYFTNMANNLVVILYKLLKEKYEEIHKKKDIHLKIN